VTRLTTSLSGFTWTNGATPNTSASNTKTGVYIEGLSNGFAITVPADTNLKRVKVYAGLYGSRSRFQASLSDFSAAPFIDTSLNNVYGNSLAAYTVNFAAASSGQSLTIRYTADALYDQTYGNVTIEAATLTQPVAVPQSLSVVASAFDLKLVTDTGFNYTVEFTDSLTPADWQVFTNFSGTGNLLNVLDTNLPGLTNRFYRVHMQ